ncbi:putative signal peptide protein [Puccinia sorghi]|uniref:Putative signal peptide protein n=1 Tax=Puccinia sorghi TaxID=27349 RepID=A0A0L6U8V7_9BASI|nr:putative signal peptide protein [Puccinia sorghi]
MLIITIFLFVFVIFCLDYCNKGVYWQCQINRSEIFRNSLIDAFRTNMYSSPQIFHGEDFSEFCHSLTGCLVSKCDMLGSHILRATCPCCSMMMIEVEIVKHQPECGCFVTTVSSQFRCTFLFHFVTSDFNSFQPFHTLAPGHSLILLFFCNIGIIFINLHGLHTPKQSKQLGLYEGTSPCIIKKSPMMFFTEASIEILPESTRTRNGRSTSEATAHYLLKKHSVRQLLIGLGGTRLLGFYICITMPKAHGRGIRRKCYHGQARICTIWMNNNYMDRELSLNWEWNAGHFKAELCTFIRVRVWYWAEWRKGMIRGGGKREEGGNKEVFEIQNRIYIMKKWCCLLAGKIKNLSPPLLVSCIYIPQRREMLWWICRSVFHLIIIDKSGLAWVSLFFLSFDFLSFLFFFLSFFFFCCFFLFIVVFAYLSSHRTGINIYNQPRECCKKTKTKTSRLKGHQILQSNHLSCHSNPGSYLDQRNKGQKAKPKLTLCVPAVLQLMKCHKFISEIIIQYLKILKKIQYYIYIYACFWILCSISKAETEYLKKILCEFSSCRIWVSRKLLKDKLRQESNKKYDHLFFNKWTKEKSKKQGQFIYFLNREAQAVRPWHFFPMLFYIDQVRHDQHDDCLVLTRIQNVKRERWI